MPIMKLVVFLLLHLAFQQCHGLYWHTKSVYVPMTGYNQTLVFDRRTLTDPRLLYGICQPGDRHKKCQIHRFKEVYGKNQKKNFMCEITIDAVKPSSSIVDKIRLVPLGRDRAIIAYLEKTNLETYLGLMTVRLTESHDCTTRKLPDLYQVDNVVANKPYELELIALPTKDNSFVAVFPDSKLCGDEYCKISVFDVNGQYIVTGPEKWFANNKKQQVVDLMPFEPSSNKFLVLEFGYGRSQFSFIKDNDLRPLKSYGPKTKKTSWTLAYTTSHERIGICNLIDTTLNCAQYDQHGYLVEKSNSEHRFNEDDDIWISAMYNLPVGQGLLVLLIEHVPNRYRILKLDSEGRMVGELDVRMFDCDWRENAIQALFFELDNQYCVTLACYDSGEFSESKKDRGHIDVVTQCFTLEDFGAVSRISKPNA